MKKRTQARGCAIQLDYLATFHPYETANQMIAQFLDIYEYDEDFISWIETNNISEESEQEDKFMPFVWDMFKVNPKKDDNNDDTVGSKGHGYYDDLTQSEANRIMAEAEIKSVGRKSKKSAPEPIEPTIFERIEKLDEFTQFAVKLFRLSHTNYDYYNEIISEHLSSGWKLERIGATELSILRVAAAELEHFDTPSKILINEYVNLSRVFCNEKSISFVNGILDSIRQHLQK